jgi:hypothetical protein
VRYRRPDGLPAPSALLHAWKWRRLVCVVQALQWDASTSGRIGHRASLPLNSAMHSRDISRQVTYETRGDPPERTDASAEAGDRTDMIAGTGPHGS